MVIEPIYGLCNRLRTVFSYNKYAKERGEPLFVIWKTTTACNGHFLDCFQPVDNMLFIDDSPAEKPLKRFKPLNWQFSFDALKLTPQLEQQLQQRLKTLTPQFAAAHIRRTDIKNFLRTQNIPKRADEEFLEFFNNDPEQSCFLATDNRQTQEFFAQRLGARLAGYDEIKPTKTRRKTSLEIAALDLFTCVAAKTFLGTPGSSFTGTIQHVRRQLKYKRNGG